MIASKWIFTPKTIGKQTYLYLQSSRYDKKERKPITSSYSLGPLKNVNSIIHNLLNTGESVFIGEAVLWGIFERLNVAKSFRKDLKALATSSEQLNLLQYLICTRVLRPFSKARLVRYLKHSFLRKFTTINHVNECYKAMTRIPRPETLFQTYATKLLVALGHSPKVSYFDTTPIFFYSDFDAFRCKGYNKYKRSDPQIKLAISVAEDYLPTSYQVYAGNVHDTKCFKNYLTNEPDCSTLLVFDAGCYSLELIKCLEGKGKGKGRCYIACCDVSNYKLKDEPTTVKLREQEWIIQEGVYQGRRVVKAHNVKNRAKGLERLSQKIQRVKHFASEVTGRDLESKQKKTHDLITSLGLKPVLSVDFKADSTTVVVIEKEGALKRRQKKVKSLVLMTSLKDPPKAILEQYLKHIDVERAFRYLKSPLSIGPVFHSTKEAIKVHIFLVLMGYLQLTALRYYLRTQYQVNLTLETLLEELNFATAIVYEPRPNVQLTYAGKQVNWMYKLLQDFNLPINMDCVQSDIRRSSKSI